MVIINSGFKPKRAQNDRLPPGQYLTEGFPVLAKRPTAIVRPDEWQLEICGLVERSEKWSWVEFQKLPQQNVEVDIHCLTKWSKFDTKWKGVSLDELVKLVGLKGEANHIIAYSSDGYATNLLLKDLVNGQAMVAVSYDDQPIESIHGGPVRLLVPHLYFWKSAKWLNKIEFVDADFPGFWETRGYHNYGDPRREQRYDFDE